jgi:hypothetical protein
MKIEDVLPLTKKEKKIAPDALFYVASEGVKFQCFENTQISLSHA